MKNKTLIVILFISLILLAGTFLVCPTPTDVCLRYDELSVFLILFSAPVFLLSLILLFLREEIFRSWKHFAYWWLPISAFFIMLAPSTDRGSFDFGMGFDREAVTWFFAVLFFLISLILIIYKSIKLRGK
jgi:cytochrome bd-type quinol oxidase subunit 2